MSDAIEGWSTRYALTRGVERVTAVPFGTGATFVEVRDERADLLEVGKEFFRFRDDALGNARMRARRRLAAMSKTRARLEQLAVTPKEAP